jgi:hypothetical protein
MRHTKLLPIVLLCFALASCAQLNHLADGFLRDRSEEISQIQRQFDERVASIERQAANKQITWVQAAREVRKLDRRANWAFDRADEEYHAYSATVAEELDAGRLTFAQYNALRKQRFSEIQRRRGRGDDNRHSASYAAKR